MVKRVLRLSAPLALIAAFVVALPALGAGTRKGVAKHTAVAHTKVRIDERADASAASDRRLARAGATRYPVGDGAGRTVAVSVTSACASSILLCNAADPQTIASFLGTLPHGSEISSLTVQITTDPEIAADCGTGAQACYFSGDSRMLISGNDTTGPDGATREFVLAHEYGHHLANNRSNPPFYPTVSYGTKRWATYEHVCEGVGEGTLFPGDEGTHYFENPGEAFAESLAFTRFPDAPVAWAWIDSLKPDAGAMEAIRQDALDPWSGPTTTSIGKGFGRAGKRSYRRTVAVPLDGNVQVKLNGTRAAQLSLKVRDASGRLLASSNKAGSSEKVAGTLCGVRKIVVVVKRTAPGAGRFTLTTTRP